MDDGKKTKRRTKKCKENGERKAKSPPSVDAFRLLMDSRSKVIGTNSPGKKAADSDDDAVREPQETRAKNKRKLFLEQWADKKGAAKRKKMEENRAAVVSKKLEKQKRNFTRMLMKSSAKSVPTIQIDGSEDSRDVCVVTESKCENSDSGNSSSEDEFLAKLKPSLKKKDISGYFKKIPDPKEPKRILNKEAKEQNKSRVKNRRAKENGLKKLPSNCATMDVDESSNTDGKENKPTQNGNENSEKARRSRRKVNYVESASDDSSLSSDTECATKNKVHRNESKKCNGKSKTNVKNAAKTVPSRKTTEIDLTCDENVKIAPMFLKNNHRPKKIVDSASIEARQKFLYSESPKILEPQTEVQTYCVPLDILFPKITHVQQISDPKDCNIGKINFLCDDATDDSLNSPKVETILDLFPSIVSEPKKVASGSLDNFKIKTYKEPLQIIKNTYPKFPAYKVFKQLKTKHNKIQQELSSNNGENDNLLWTEKYRPLCAEDIIGNFKSVDILKKWLSTWKECSRDIIAKNSRTDSNSSDDFYSSDSDSECSKLPNNTLIIGGPQGSGKTSSVYAIANELDINILEINASSKRTGKKIMVELQEATQSHKVSIKTNQLDSHSEESGKHLSRKKPDRTKNKYSKKSKSVSRKEKEISSKVVDNKMSLMLIEDADIVFEEDDGFISSLTQIMQISKRPIIITISDMKCNHLRKVMQDCNVLRYHSVVSNILAPWLDILMLVETRIFVPRLSRSLIEFYSGDIRKTISQLQFWISNNEVTSLSDNDEIADSKEEKFFLDDDSNSSSNEVASNNKTIDRAPLCIPLFNKITSFTYVIEKDIEKLHELNCKQLRTIESFQNESYKIMNTMDLFSVIDVKLRLPKMRNCVFENSYLIDGLSDVESQADYVDDNFNEEWREYLIDRCKKMTAIDNQDINFERTQKRSFEKSTATTLELSKSMPLTTITCGSNLALDYLPFLRDICRTEKLRSEAKVKRNNRFYHYFKSVNINVADTVFDDACDILNVD